MHGSGYVEYQFKIIKNDLRDFRLKNIPSFLNTSGWTHRVEHTGNFDKAELDLKIWQKNCRKTSGKKICRKEKHAGKMPENAGKIIAMENNWQTNQLPQWKDVLNLLVPDYPLPSDLEKERLKNGSYKDRKKQLIRIREQINRFNYQFSPFLDLQTGWIQNNAIYTARGIKASIIRCCDEGYFSHFIAFGCWRKIISRLIICPINFKKGFDIRTLGGW